MVRWRCIEQMHIDVGDAAAGADIKSVGCRDHCLDEVSGFLVAVIQRVEQAQVGILLLGQRIQLSPQERLSVEDRQQAEDGPLEASGGRHHRRVLAFGCIAPITRVARKRLVAIHGVSTWMFPANRSS